METLCFLYGGDFRFKVQSQHRGKLPVLGYVCGEGRGWVESLLKILLLLKSKVLRFRTVTFLCDISIDG